MKENPIYKAPNGAEAIQHVASIYGENVMEDITVPQQKGRDATYDIALKTNRSTDTRPIVSALTPVGNITNATLNAKRYSVEINVTNFTTDQRFINVANKVTIASFGGGLSNIISVYYNSAIRRDYTIASLGISTNEWIKFTIEVENASPGGSLNTIIVPSRVIIRFYINDVLVDTADTDSDVDINLDTGGFILEDPTYLMGLSSTTTLDEGKFRNYKVDFRRLSDNEWYTYQHYPFNEGVGSVASDIMGNQPDITIQNLQIDSWDFTNYVAGQPAREIQPGYSLKGDFTNQVYIDLGSEFRIEADTGVSNYDGNCYLRYNLRIDSLDSGLAYMFNQSEFFQHYFDHSTGLLQLRIRETSAFSTYINVNLNSYLGETLIVEIGLRDDQPTTQEAYLNVKQLDGTQIGDVDYVLNKSDRTDSYRVQSYNLMCATAANGTAQSNYFTDNMYVSNIQAWNSIDGNVYWFPIVAGEQAKLYDVVDSNTSTIQNLQSDTWTLDQKVSSNYLNDVGYVKSWLCKTDTNQELLVPITISGNNGTGITYDAENDCIQSTTDVAFRTGYDTALTFQTNPFGSNSPAFHGYYSKIRFKGKIRILSSTYNNLSVSLRYDNIGLNSTSVIGTLTPGQWEDFDYTHSTPITSSFGGPSIYIRDSNGSLDSGDRLQLKDFTIEVLKVEPISLRDNYYLSAAGSRIDSYNLDPDTPTYIKYETYKGRTPYNANIINQPTLEFENVNANRIDIDDNNVRGNGDAWKFCCTVNQKTALGGGGIIFARHGASNTYVTYEPQNGYIRVRGDGVSYLFRNQNLPRDEKAFIYGYKDELNRTYVWVNGIPCDINGIEITENIQFGRIGDRTGGSSIPFNGNINGLAFWSEAGSFAEQELIRKNGGILLGSLSEPDYYFPFQEAFGDTAYNLGSMGNKAYAVTNYNAAQRLTQDYYHRNALKGYLKGDIFDGVGGQEYDINMNRGLSGTRTYISYYTSGATQTVDSITRLSANNYRLELNSSGAGQGAGIELKLQSLNNLNNPEANLFYRGETYYCEFTVTPVSGGSGMDWRYYVGGSTTAIFANNSNGSYTGNLVLNNIAGTILLAIATFNNGTPATVDISVKITPINITVPNSQANTHVPLFGNISTHPNPGGRKLLDGVELDLNPGNAPALFNAGISQGDSRTNQTAPLSNMLEQGERDIIVYDEDPNLPINYWSS